MAESSGSVNSATGKTSKLIFLFLVGSSITGEHDISLLELPYLSQALFYSLLLFKLTSYCCSESYDCIKVLSSHS